MSCFAYAALFGASSRCCKLMLVLVLLFCCPATGQTISSSMLCPNNALKSMAQEWLAQNPGYKEPEPPPTAGMDKLFLTACSEPGGSRHLPVYLIFVQQG
jgi:hypothetical protein